MREDWLLIRRLRRGDQAALRRIYEKYKDDMLTVANNLLLDLASAEDCLHDVFVNFAARVGQFRLTRNLKGYLVTCVANRARDLLRAKSHRDVSLSAIAEPPANAHNPAVALVDCEEASHLQKALAELPYDQRQVIVLHLNGGLKFRQIAKLHGVSINTVQSRYHYGLEKLRKLLGRRDCDEQ